MIASPATPPTTAPTMTPVLSSSELEPMTIASCVGTLATAVVPAAAAAAAILLASDEAVTTALLALAAWAGAKVATKSTVIERRLAVDETELPVM